MKLRPKTEAELIEDQIRMRRGEDVDRNESEDWGELEDEFEEWNESYG